MTEQSQHGLAGPLLAQLSGRFSAQELAQVAHAFDFADRWHEGQRRKSGDRYVTHPLAVAEAAATVGLDCTMVCAALLHDVLEDTDCDPELLRAEFGVEVADLVERHTALSHGDGAPDDDQAITLKLLDRLHNMRTIEYLDAGKQLSRSRQTLELLVPQARRLGLPVVADELQELARRRIEVLGGEGGGITATLCALRIGSLVLPAAARNRYLEEWAAELGWPAGRRGRRRFARQLLLGLPRLSVMLRRPQWDDRCAGIAHRVAASRLSRSGLKTLRWLLRSEARPWALLTPLTAWIIMQTAQGNAGSAVATVITLPPVLAAAVKWLRGRLGLTHRHNERSD
jgi:HD domain-containing protein